MAVTEAITRPVGSDRPCLVAAFEVMQLNNIICNSCARNDSRAEGNRWFRGDVTASDG